MSLFKKQLIFLLVLFLGVQVIIGFHLVSSDSVHAQNLTRAREMLAVDQEYDLESVFVKYKQEDTPRLLRIDSKSQNRYTIASAESVTDQKEKLQKLEQKITELLNDPNVEHVQPQFIYTLESWSDGPQRDTPNDYLINPSPTPSSHWYYENSRLRELWNDQNCANAGSNCGGNDSAVVAVIDTGLAFENFDSPWGDKFRVNQVLERRVASSASSGNTLVSLTGTPFVSAMVGKLVFNGTLNQYAIITAISGSPSSQATVELYYPTVGGPINDTWDNHEFDILDQGSDMFTFGPSIDSDKSLPMINIYKNTSEIENSGSDSDGNGYIDDVYGVNTADYVWCTFISTCSSSEQRSIGHPNDDHGHGTYVTGLVASLVANGYGSVSPAHKLTIMPIKANFYHNRSFGSMELWYGIDYAVNHGADVINMSLSGPVEDIGLTQKIQWARENGVVVVAATGNTASSVQYPAASEGAIAVGALRPNGERAFYSNFGPGLDVSAYVGNGAGIGDTVYQRSYSCFFASPGCQTSFAYNSFSNGMGIGTSYAAPQVSALAGLLRAVKPNITVNKIEEVLYSTAIDVSSPGYDESTGWGAINYQATYAAVVNNVSPTLSILQPDGISDTADQFYNITWVDSDPDSNARINLFWDNDNSGFDGTPIEGCSNISEDSSTNSCQFDIRGMNNGSYYVYGCITDGINAEVCSYSTGQLTVSHTIRRDSGTTGVTTTPHRVNFSESFSAAPVVFVQVTEEFGPDMVYTNLTNITATGFDIAIEENTRSGFDGIHTIEGLSWYAVSATSPSEQVGTLLVDHNWRQVTFNTPFVSIPKILANTQSEFGTDIVNIDIRNVTLTGFEIRLEEPPGYDGLHTFEWVGWTAFNTHPLSGSQSGTNSSDHNWKTIVFPTPFASRPVLLAEVQSEVGADESIIDIRNLTNNGFDFRIEEDPFLLDGVHAEEGIAWLAIPATAQAEITQKFSIDAKVGQSNWVRVPFLKIMENNPYIFASISSENGGDTVEVDIRNINRVGFEARLEEDLRAGWDGGHLAETVDILVVDPMLTSLVTGTISGDHNWTDVTFSVPFVAVPRIVATIQTENGGDTAMPDLRNITTEGFQVRVEEDVIAGWDGNHVNETIAWLALEPTDIPVGHQSGIVSINQPTAKNQLWNTVVFPTPFTSIPNIVFEINTENGADAVQADIRNLTSTGFQVRLEEEPNRYDGMHTFESFVWYARPNNFLLLWP
ncbi:MAG: S8 family serine peptidase [Candidatus Dojkabacteria bacterium]|nr:MAG: S8 family serine peptidase [Candidatus Dojkabacteria bacterium]